MADFETNSEIDIEDLEARLYGQIYHSTLSEEIDMQSQKNPRDYELNRLNNKKSNRYYENPDINVVPQPYQPNKFIGLSNSNSFDDQTGGMPQNFYNHTNNLYNYQNPLYNETYANRCQQFMLPGSPSINNIVVIPPAPTQYFSTAFHPLFDKSKKRKRSKLRKKMLQNTTQTPFKQHRKQKKNIVQTQPNKTTNSNSNDNSETQSNSEAKSSSNIDVVVLSDSNDSDVEEVIFENTIIDISSNDEENAVEELGAEECNVKATENEEKVEKKEDEETVKGTQVKEENQQMKEVEKNPNLETDTEDDVIVLVEEPVEQEIIEVDDTKDSFCSADITIIPKEKSLTATMQTEEVSSTLADFTNDFLDGVQLGQHYFNFQLHGSDFYCSKSTGQSKSNVNNEAYETESSCSTVDIPVNNSTALNDIGFDAPCKEAFDEPNLESFANFITPKRNLEAISSSESLKLKRKKSKSPKSKPQDGEEEDLNEEEKKLKNKKKSKDVIEQEEDQEKSQKKKKRAKSREHCDESNELLDIENEHDSSIIPLESSESGTPEPKKKKKRKNEKNTQKSSQQQEFYDSIDQNDDTGEAPQTSVSSKKRKRKNKQEECTVKPDTSTVSVEYTNDSDSDISIYTVDYESDNNSNSNLSFCTIAEIGGTARDKLEDEEDSFDDLRSISDVGEDVEMVNVDMGQEKYPLEKPGRVNRERKQFSDFWNNDMEKFYSDSWGHENFSVSESQKLMSDDPNIWKILDQDRYLYFRPKGPRCRSCRQWGHPTFRCPNKSNSLVCSLCGGKGHMEPRCPNKLCTSCGQQMNYFTTYCTKCKGFMYVICNICNLRGHPTKLCPDQWRRYHLTTEEGPVVSPESDLMKPFHKRWCSGCGSQGHFEYDCKYYNRTHSATLLTIQSYEPVYLPILKSPVKRKQENEDGSTKKKQLKTGHPQTDKNKGEIGCEHNLNESGKSREEKGQNQQETGQKCKDKNVIKSKEKKQQETAVKSRNTNKKEQRKEKDKVVKSKQGNKETTLKLKDKSKEDETSQLVEEIVVRSTEVKSHQEEGDKQKDKNSAGQCKEVENSDSLEINHSKSGESEMQKENLDSEEKQEGETAVSSSEEKTDEIQEKCSMETSKSQEENPLEITVKSHQSYVEDEVEKTKCKENNSNDEISKCQEEDQNEAVITKYTEIIEHDEVSSEGTDQEKLQWREKIIKQELIQSHNETLEKDNEKTIVEEASTLQEKIQPEIEQQGTSKDQQENKTSTYEKKLQEFAENIKEICKTTIENSKPLSKKQRRKAAKKLRQQQKQQQQQQQQPQPQPQQPQSQKKKKNKCKREAIQTRSQTGSLLGNPVGSQFLINPWAPFVSSILNPQAFLSPGNVHLQNPNFYGSAFHANNYPFHVNLQDLFSGSIFSSPAFLNARPFVAQEHSNLGQVQPCLGQGQQNIGQEPSNNNIQMNMGTIDLTEPNGNVNDLTNTGRDQRIQEVDLTTTSRDDNINTVNNIDLNQPKMQNPTVIDPFTIVLTAKECSLMKRAHGRFFMRDMCTNYGIKYSYYDKRTMILQGNINENTMDMIKAEINDYIRFYYQSNGFFPLPKDYSDAKQVVKEYFDFMGPLERLTFHFSTLVRLNNRKSRHPSIVQRMTYKIVSLNRILIGKLFLKNGRKHLDILKNRFLKGGSVKGEIKEQEWDSLNESFNSVFQNDSDELLCIEFLSNLPTHVVPKEFNDNVWKNFVGLNKEDRNSIHFILNNPEARFCTKNLFHFLDAERIKSGRNAKKKGKHIEEVNQR